MANAPAPKRKVSGPALGKATAKRTTKAGGITAGTAFGGGKIPASMLKKAKQMAKLKGKK